MQKYVWDLHFKFDREYWWAQGRKELIVSQLKKQVGNLKGKKILDLGCGSGVLLEELTKLGAEPFGIDTSSRAISFCKKLGLVAKRADVIRMPFKSSSFDVVCLVDTLEHIKNEKKVFAEVKRVLKKRGFFLIIVPAYKVLWSSRDKRLGHLRRYTKNDLEKLTVSCGFKRLKASYFVFSFFPFWLLRTFLERTTKRTREIKTDLLLVPAWISSILLAILRLENFWLKFLNLPFGVSVFLIARKPGNEQE